jgi:uncharacterized LabA/DUF88 family protein
MAWSLIGRTGASLPHQDRLNIAVFIDFDNIEIGVKSTLGQQFDVGTILDAIKERGEVVTKIAYADWTRAGEYSRTLTQHAIRLVQRNLTPGGDKNGADINLALDALEMAFTHPHINAYVIVGGDSDFLSLVEKLKQYDKKVFVVGGRAFTSVILQRNCHEFIAYENLAGVRKQSVKEGRPMAPPASLPIAQAFPIVRRALKILADREVSPQTGLLKSTLLQLDSTFSERNYGASSFLDFVEKLSHPGLVQLKHSGRSVMVELNDGFDDGDPATADQRARSTTGGEAPMDQNPGAQAPSTPVQVRPAGELRAGFGAAPERRDRDIEARGTEPAADGVKRVAEVLHAATGARWPMYLRNVKQLLRAADAGFDERQYGFTGLVELVRACQKEGLVRLERDRRGGLRVFPGPGLQRATVAAAQPVERAETADTAPVPAVETTAPETGETLEATDPELVDNEPMPTSDPTAELLGTTKRKRASRTTVQGAARGGRPAARKIAPRKTLAAGRRRSRKKDALEKSDV